MPGYRSHVEPTLFTIGLQWTQIRPGAAGADFALGTVPRALMEGVAVAGLRAGVAIPVMLRPGAALLPSAGVSLIAGLGLGGGGGIAGFNAGVSAVAFGAGSSAGLRAGVTWHRFADADGAIWLAELGFARLR